MTTFQPKYQSYKERFLNGLGRMFIATLIFIVILFIGNTKEYVFIILGFFVLFLSFNIYNLVRRNRKYLKSLTITDKEVKAVIFDKDEEFRVLKSDLQNTRIKIFEIFFDFNQYGRNFKLQIDIKQNGKFETVFEQYEIGNWDLKIFKEIYASYCEIKKVPYSLSSLKRENF